MGNRNKKQKHKQGFSLIELSIIISVAAILMVGFLSYNNSSIISDADKTIITQKRIETIATALENFRVRQGRLPCPADPLIREDNSYLTSSNDDLYVNNFGLEDLDTIQTKVNNTTTLGIDCPNNIGSVPIYSIGLDISYLLDGWNRRFTYHVSDNLCGHDQGVEVVGANASKNKGCTQEDYQNNNGNITIYDKDSNIITKVAAFVVLSHGKNGFGATLPSSENVGTGGGSFDIENYNGDNSYIYSQSSNNKNNDDLLLSRTKVQIEQLTNKKDSIVISKEKCEANSTSIANITADYMAGVRTALPNYEQQGLNTGDQVSLGIFLSLQEVCVSYYGVDSTADIWNGARCPGTGLYNSILHSCDCPTGDWTNCCPGDDWSACLDS